MAGNTYEYDVYLNGTGYMLARSADGRLLSGAAREQRRDPFTNYLSQAQRWAKQTFRFGEGGGLAEADGSFRYESAEYMDSRSGRLMMAPKRNLCQARTDQERIAFQGQTLNGIECSTSAYRARAERFLVPAGKVGIRSVCVMVKRNPGVNYDTATTFTLGIETDTAGPKPSGTGFYVTGLSIKTEPPGSMAFPDRWAGGEYFWLEAQWTANQAVTAGNYYWITLDNNQAPPLFWAENGDGASSYYRSYFTGGGWVNGTLGKPLMWKIRYADEIYSFPRAFASFRGIDGIERVFAAVPPKIMYYDEATAKWVNSYVPTGGSGPLATVSLVEFNSRLFVAGIGTGALAVQYDGTTPTTNWTSIGVSAACFAVHDNYLWRADVRSVNASATGLSGSWGATAVDVGDPGTTIQAMISHGGKLYAAKREGIYEISYPSTYPGSGKPTANMMLDFRTEQGIRQWLLDWHSGLYFPGFGGVHELKSGVLRNLWTERIDEGAQEVAPAKEKLGEVWARGGSYTIPRRWGPIYDARPGGWMAACGTTRGLILTYSDPHLYPPDLWWYDSRNWHQLGPLAPRYSSTSLEVAEYSLAVFLHDRGGGMGRLWYGCGTNIGYMKVPTWTLDRAQDSRAEYHSADDGYCYTPRFALEDRHTLIDFHGVAVHSRNAGESNGGRIYIGHKIDNAASWTWSSGLVSSPYVLSSFPASTTGRSIQLAVRLEPLVNKNVMVEQIDLLYQPLPDTVATWQLTLQVSPTISRASGAPDGRTAGQIAAELENLLNLTEPWTFQDWRGINHTVRAMGLTAQAARQIEEPGLPGYGLEEHCILTLLEV